MALPRRGPTLMQLKPVAPQPLVLAPLATPPRVVLVSPRRAISAMAQGRCHLRLLLLLVGLQELQELQECTVAPCTVGSSYNLPQQQRLLHLPQQVWQVRLVLQVQSLLQRR